jgi:ATP-dependent RNA helicase RhlE
MTFDQLLLAEPLLRSLQSEGYTQPTPIQEKAITPIMQQQDLLGCAQTGTGKTAAFALPVLHLLYNRKNAGDFKPNTIKVLVLTPTRELAIQVEESFRVYGRHTGIRSAVVFGGVSQHSQEMAVRRGVDVLVATPGRLMDLINQGIISLRSVEIFILDEADRMLDMGFINDIRRIVPMLPKQRQTLFFSATMPKEIRSLADSLLTNPAFVEVAPVSSTAETISQEVFFVEKNNKRALLTHLLDSNEIKRVLIFTRTKHGADKVTRDLNKQGVKAEAIHGNKAQNARQKALSAFKAGSIRVLVATDIAARGIDVDDISHVINFELPNEPETYVHRIGRTGRAGANGKAYSFCDTEERAYLKDIQKLIKKPIPVASDHPFVSEYPVAQAILLNENPPQRGREVQSVRNGNPQLGKRPSGRSGYFRSRSNSPR